MVPVHNLMVPVHNLMVPVHNSLSETVSTRLFFQNSEFSWFLGRPYVVYTACYLKSAARCVEAPRIRTHDYCNNNINSQLDETIIILLIKLLLLHLVGCLYYCIGDARSHKHQIHYYCCSEMSEY